MSLFGKNKICEYNCETCGRDCILHRKHSETHYCGRLECALQTLKFGSKELCNFPNCILSKDHFGVCEFKDGFYDALTASIPSNLNQESLSNKNDRRPITHDILLQTEKTTCDHLDDKKIKIEHQQHLCPQCQTPVLKKQNEFCSKDCFLQSKRTTKKCEYCENEFVVLLCFSEKKCCSPKCTLALKRKENPSVLLLNFPCSWCGTFKKRYASTIRASNQTFCNRSCYDEFHSQFKVIKNCEACQNEFKTSSKHGRKFCSRECYKKSYVPHNFANTKVKKGWFQSNKGGKIWYDSGLELRRMKEFDFDQGVTKFSRCKDKILWVKADGTRHFYNPDFIVEYDGGTKIIEECKGFKNSDTQLKIEAARTFYENSEFIFRVIYYDDLDEKLEYWVENYENSLGSFNRPRVESIFMKCAFLFSERSTCNRLQVGAVFVDTKSEQVLCFGFNGTYANGPNDCDSLEPGKCGCIHAEINAISKATQTLENSTLFVTTAPCFSCAKVLINRRISRVIYGKAYRDVSGIKLLRKSGIEIMRYNDLVDFLD